MTRGKYERTEELRERTSKAYRGKTREKCNRWKGGFKKSYGYICFLLPKGCRFSCMADVKGYVKLNRLIMAEFLQRPLTKDEVVHHKNGDIADNRIENLELLKNQGRHIAYHNKLRVYEGYDND